MNRNEYGNYIRVNLNTDLSPYDMSLILKSPPPYVKEAILSKNEGLIIGSTDITIGDEVFLSGQYIEYKILKGDIFLSGNWGLKVLAKSISGNELRFTDNISFYVSP